MGRQSFEPMTLGNMRQNGVRSLAVYCGAINCHHQVTLDVERYPDDVPVPSFGAADAVRCVWPSRSRRAAELERAAGLICASRRTLILQRSRSADRITFAPCRPCTAS